MINAVNVTTDQQVKAAQQRNDRLMALNPAFPGSDWWEAWETNPDAFYQQQQQRAKNGISSINRLKICKPGLVDLRLKSKDYLRQWLKKQRKNNWRLTILQSLIALFRINISKEKPV